MHAVLLCKSFDEIMLVFIDPFNQVVSHTDVECAIALAGEDVDVKLHHYSICQNIFVRIPTFVGMTAIIVTPAEAGVQCSWPWMPTFVGMTAIIVTPP